MVARIAVCLLAFAVFTACETTTRTSSSRKSVEGRYASHNDASAEAEPMPPAQGPEDIPAEGPLDVNRNPALVPSPLLRDVAASHP